MSQNQSYCSACGPSSQTARPAMKKGEERKSCVSENTRSHVPRTSGASVGSAIGLSISRRSTSVLAAARSEVVAASPRLQPAASASSCCLSGPISADTSAETGAAAAVAASGTGAASPL